MTWSSRSAMKMRELFPCSDCDKKRRDVAESADLNSIANASSSQRGSKLHHLIQEVLAIA